MCLKSRSLAFMAKLDFCRWKFLRQRISRLPLGLDVGFRTNSLLLDFPSVDSLFCLVCFFIFLYFWCWKFVCQQNWRPSPPYKSRLSLFPCLFLAPSEDSLHYGDQRIQTKSWKWYHHRFFAPWEDSLYYGDQRIQTKSWKWRLRSFLSLQEGSLHYSLVLWFLLFVFSPFLSVF